jgi:hypothetical protein
MANWGHLKRKKGPAMPNQSPATGRKERTAPPSPAPTTDVSDLIEVGLRSSAKKKKALTRYSRRPDGVGMVAQVLVIE